MSPKLNDRNGGRAPARILAGAARCVLSSGACALAVGNAAAQQPPRILEHPAAVFSVFFSPAGDGLLTADLERTLRLWDAGSVGVVRELSSGPTRGALWTAGFSPDGRFVFAGDEIAAARWDVRTGEVVNRLAVHDAGLAGLTISADGGSLLTLGGDDVAYLWNAETGAELWRFDVPGRLSAIGLSSDGALVALGVFTEAWDTATDLPAGEPPSDPIVLWYAGSDEPSARLPGHTDQIWSLAFSPDGATLLSSSSDGTVAVWGIATETRVHLLEHPGQVQSAAFSPDGQWIVTGCADAVVRLWNAQTGALMRTFEGHGDEITSVAFAPDGASIASASFDGTARIWMLR
ncbi:MAG: WD40 repeat domain-containing protein [Longimicrobiales bacterium]